MKRVLFMLFALVAFGLATAEAVSGENAGSGGDSGANAVSDVGKAGGGVLPDMKNPETVKIIVAVVGALIALFLFVFVIMFLIGKLRNKEYDVTIDDGMTMPDSTLEKKLNKRIEELEYRVDDLATKLTNLINMLNSGSFGQKTNVGAAVPMLPMSPPPPPPVEERKKEIFYFANPLSGGSFKVEKAFQNPDTALYRFERFVGEGKARVFVIDEPRVVRRFTERPEAQDSVCDDGGDFKPDAKRIEVAPGCDGVAVLEGDSWKVIQKVKIKYI
ncbi:hypothetical protein R80B4_01514 [Fibrobacteres bacterium R8-0-B4]